jgi:hypothetical protein
MAIIVTLAKTSKQKAAAFQLLKEVYLQTYQINLDELHRFHPEKFKSDILIAHEENDTEILGTMSIIYPNNQNLYPSETLFGFDFGGLNISRKNYVEVGRFATAKKAKGKSCVVISLFLGALKFFKNNNNITGWTGTIKDDVLKFLNCINLPINIINQLPKLKEGDILHNYVGNPVSIYPFHISVADTIASFAKFNNYLERGVIKVKL